MAKLSEPLRNEKAADKLVGAAPSHDRALRQARLGVVQRAMLAAIYCSL